jgi:hypothetical protein
MRIVQKKMLTILALLGILLCVNAFSSSMLYAQLTAASRPFAVDANTGLQRVLGVFESEDSVALIGLYVTNNDGFTHTNVQITMSAPMGSGIEMTSPISTIGSLPPGVPTLVFFEADFSGVIPNKYDMNLALESDQAGVTNEMGRIFTTTTTLNLSDPDFGGRPTFRSVIPEGITTVDIETFEGGPSWRSRWAPTRETVLIEHTPPFEGQIGPVPYADWFWKAVGLVGKCGVAFASGYYIAEGIDEGDCVKTVAASGGALMTIAECATWSDDADPFIRGQQNTFPSLGEKTFKEIVTLNSVFLDEPTFGDDFQAMATWTYTRFTVDSNAVETTYHYAITDELVTNAHWGGTHTLQTDRTEYVAGDIAMFTATIEANNGSLLVADEAYLAVIVQPSPEIGLFVILSDDGQGADDAAGNGVYSGSLQIPNTSPPGDWSMSLFAQENLFGFNEYGGMVLDSFPEGGAECGTFQHGSFTVVAPKPTVQIEKTHDTYQGHYEFVSVTLEDNPVEIGGFDFLIAYDASALAFIEATPGQLLEDCEWEYFTYRSGAFGNCGDACPSGLLRIIAMAETNNGPYHPSCFGPPDTDPHELAEMKFYVTDDRTYECQYVPIRFFWGDCGDNTISDVSGETVWISDHVYDFEGNEVTGDIFYGGHWWLGDCDNPDTTKPSAIPFIDYVNGGIDIICADSIDAPGDINLNNVANEIADAVLFTNYFIYGPGVFNINPEGQIAASDVNNDGKVLTVGDLVYMVRIITGDAMPFPKLSPFAQSASVNMLVNHSAVAISTNSEADIGAGNFVFEHSGYEIGEPQLINGASNMTLKYHDENGVLKVLVYSMEKDIKISAGTENIFAIPISGDGTIDLIETELSDYNGNLLTVTKSEQPILPKTFALHQNYPNPFNATTQIIYEVPKTAHVKIDIFNIIGQKVVTLIDCEESAGVHAIEWNGLDRSGDRATSGVYLYRLTTDNFTSEKKMVLLK